MREILKTLVGSRAHGTFLPESDYDYRGVFMVDPKDFISPFRNVKNNHWIEGKEDNTAYELGHFCKLCAHGNPSALELLAAPIISTSDAGDELRKLLPKFLSKQCCAAFMGYSRSQEKKFRDNHLDRRWKYAEAHARTLYQLLALLRSGELRIGWEGGTLEELCAIKRGMRTEAECMARVLQLEEECRSAELVTKLPEGPDIPAIEEFIFRSYLPHEQFCESKGAGKMG